MQKAPIRRVQKVQKRVEYVAPAPKYQAPKVEYRAPAPEYHAPVPEYRAPAPEYKVEPVAHGRSYGKVSYGKPAPRLVSARPASYGKDWVRRSSIRPRDITAYAAEPVDSYYTSGEDKADETIVASCEFDFLGYSMSSGHLEII